jgi:rod shape-determining protein MreC
LNLFNLEFKKVLFALFVIALPLMSFNMQRRPGEAPWYLRPFSLTADFVRSGLTGFSGEVQGTVALYLNLIQIKKDNRVLKKENDEMRAHLALLQELKLENERLNDLINFKNRTNMKLLAAKVTGLDLVRDHKTVFIDRGTQHGLKAGMPVIATEGVVGYVFRPELYSSQVLLLTDRFAVIDAIVQRSRARGLVEGESSDSCILQNLGRADDVKEGDLVVTSGLDNIFPKGFPIAVVTSVAKNSYGVSQDVKLRPVMSSYHLDEVFVITTSTEEVWGDLDSSDKTEEAKTAMNPTTTTITTRRPMSQPEKTKKEPQ